MTKQRKKVPSGDFREHLARRLRDPEFAHHFGQRRLIHEVARAVRSMREGADLTQAELAKAIGTSQPTIARLERGLDQRAPRWDTLNRIALALGRQLRLTFVEDAEAIGPLVVVKGRRSPARGRSR